MVPYTRRPTWKKALANAIQRPNFCPRGSVPSLASDWAIANRDMLGHENALLTYTKLGACGTGPDGRREYGPVFPWAPPGSTTGPGTTTSPLLTDWEPGLVARSGPVAPGLVRGGAQLDYRGRSCHITEALSGPHAGARNRGTTAQGWLPRHRQSAFRCTMPAGRPSRSFATTTPAHQSARGRIVFDAANTPHCAGLARSWPLQSNPDNATRCLAGRLPRVLRSHGVRRRGGSGLTRVAQPDVLQSLAERSKECMRCSPVRRRTAGLITGEQRPNQQIKRARS